MELEAAEQPVQVQEPVTLSQLRLDDALADLWNGLKKHRIWIALSWQEFNSTYRRSMLGVLWVILSFAGFLFVKLLVFSSLLETDDARYYDAYLVLGFFMWIYISSVVNGAPDTFVSSQGWIRSEPLPLSLYVYKKVTREFYNMVLTFTAVVAAMAYIKYPVGYGALYGVLGVAFLLLNAAAIKLLLGIVCARFRDLSHLIKAIMMPMMFLTPIFWTPEQMPGLMKYLWWNPLYHYIELFRAPVLTGEFPTVSWMFSGTVFLIVSTIGFLAFARFRQRIVFWF